MTPPVNTTNGRGANGPSCARAREAGVLLALGGVLVDGGRLSLRREEAAQALGISDESFDRYVRPFVPVVRLGSLRLYPVAGLQAFLDEHGSSPMEDVAA